MLWTELVLKEISFIPLTHALWVWEFVYCLKVSWTKRTLNVLTDCKKQINKQTDNKNVNEVRDDFEAWKVLGQNAFLILPELSKVCPQLHDVPAESRLDIRISRSERVYQRWNFRERCSKYKANVITVKCTCQLGKFGKIRTMLKHVEINRLFSLEKKE